MGTMNLKQLAYFVAVVDAGSFTLGAARLGVGQPAASAAIRRLEADIGVELLRRSGPTIEMTPAGETLLPGARRCLAAAEQGQAAVRAVLGDHRGTARISASVYLSAFATSAQERNFTVAARRLGLTQPTVSAAVTKLERELDAQLFTRSRPLELTDAGAALLPHALEALNALEQTQSELRSVAQGSGGTLRLGSSVFTFDLDVTTIIHSFRRRHPAIRLTLVEHLDIHEMSAEILAGRLDMGITITVEPPPAGVRADTLRSEPYVFVCSPSHPLAQRERVTVEDLRDQPFVGRRRGDQFRQLMDETCAALGFEPDVALEVDGYEISLNAMRSGTAIGLSVPVIAQLFPDQFKILPVDTPPTRPLRLVLLSPTNRIPTAAASTLRDDLLAASTSLRGVPDERP